MNVLSKTFDGMVKKYQARGVDPLAYEKTVDDEYIPTSFRCRACGQVFSPVQDVPESRWYHCPHGCNKSSDVK